MIFIRHDPRAATLMGTGLAVGGSTSVQRLQQSLQQLAVVVNRPGINPGPADGLVNQQVLLAIVQAFNILAEKLPSEAKYPLQLALLAGTFTPQAVNLVKAYADVLNAAAQAAIMKYTQAPNVPLPPTPGPTGPGQGAYPNTGAGAYPTPPPATPVPWFKTTGGMVGLGAGAVGGLLLLIIALK